MIKVTVPATTANMGPGFDTLGLALNLYNSYIFEETDEGLLFEGIEDKYLNKENLIYKSFKKTQDILGKDIKGLKISMDAKIPVSRGLGSSSACIVAGVFGANALLNGGLCKDELFKIAAETEGHPDNVAPAVYGGLTASLMDGKNTYCVNYNISDSIKFCALIPEFETSTYEARKLLPKFISFKDGVYNISRTAVLLKALEEGNLDIIHAGLKDKIHQKYRKTLIHEYEDVKSICEKNGSVAFFISGAGPTVMNVIRDSDFTNRIRDDIMGLKYKWDIKLLTTDKFGVTIQ